MFEDAVDESRLDRSEQLGPCGYPGPGVDGYGTELGQRLADFTLIDCEGEEFQFAELMCKRDDAYGDYNRAILLSIGAGWCEPCIEETEILEAEINQPYCGGGLRVVQALFQDEDGGPATKFACSQWRERFGLTFPVLQDWQFITRKYFEAAQTPLNLLVDKNGVIRFRSTGTAAPDLPQRIEELLAEIQSDGS